MLTQTIVEKVKQRDPEAAATFKGSELMVRQLIRL